MARLNNVRLELDQMILKFKAIMRNLVGRRSVFFLKRMTPGHENLLLLRYFLFPAARL